jgi:hypothetical protein
LSITLFEKLPLSQALTAIDALDEDVTNHNQLTLFNL